MEDRGSRRAGRRPPNAPANRTANTCSCFGSRDACVTSSVAARFAREATQASRLQCAVRANADIPVTGSTGVGCLVEAPMTVASRTAVAVVCVATLGPLARAQVMQDGGFEDYAVAPGGFVKPTSGVWSFSND